MGLAQNAQQKLSKSDSLNQSSFKKIAIMQPTYLPWCGYFDLMDSVDEFILLDTVAFSKQSFHQRNRIRTAQGMQWLTVPVLSKGKAEQLLHQTEISDQHALKKHFKAFAMNYKKAPYWDCYEPDLRKFYSQEYSSLTDFTTCLIMWLRDQLGIDTKLIKASELGAPSEGKLERLISFCQARQASEYISPEGARNYLDEASSSFLNQGIKLSFQNYEHPEYTQLYTPFMPYAGGLDLLLLQGPESLNIIRKGRKL